METQPKTILASEKFRGLCLTCLRPPLTCYCKHVAPFDPQLKFVILIHGREAQKRIATGRIAHLCLKNSELIQGYDYSDNDRVNELIHSEAYQPFVLYPGENSLDLGKLDFSQRETFVQAGKQVLIFVIDGTWTTARKTMLRSKNLQRLPRICFEPSRPSRFRLRKQPKPNFFSTIEAIHQTIELFGKYDPKQGEHNRLLDVFDQMVEQQIELSKRPKTYCIWRPNFKKKLLPSHPELPRP